MKILVGDHVLFRWAQEHGHAVFTHDLDFGAILAATQARAPSVVQIRTQDPHPSYAASLVLNVFQQFRDHIATGALISVDPRRSRARILPLGHR